MIGKSGLTRFVFFAWMIPDMATRIAEQGCPKPLVILFFVAGYFLAWEAAKPEPTP